jgi:hypothetical protein
LIDGTEVKLQPIADIKEPAGSVSATSYDRCAHTFFLSIRTAATLAMSPEPRNRFPDNKKSGCMQMRYSSPIFNIV